MIRPLKKDGKHSDQKSPNKGIKKNVKYLSNLTQNLPTRVSQKLPTFLKVIR
jgi:hypothetical protein